MDELARLKNIWQNTEAPEIGNLADADIAHLRHTNSIHRRLVSRQRRVIFIGVVGLAFIPFFIAEMDVELPVVLGLFLFFFLACILNFLLWRQIYNFDPASATTVQTIKMVESYTRRRTVYRIIMIALAVPILSALFISLEAHDNIFVLIGMLSGGAVGLVFGLLCNAAFSRDLRDLRRLLSGSDPS